MDPLRTLRDFYTANRLDEVKLVEGRVLFGRSREYEFSGDVKTNFLSSINKQAYTLAQLLLFIQNSENPPAEYAKLALKLHIPPVYTADKQTLTAFLKGEQELAALDDKRPLEEGEEEEPAFKKEAPKKVRRKDIEGKLRSRENLLVLSHKDFKNCIEVYAKAERAYTEARKHDGKAKSAAQAKSSRMDRPNVSQSTKQHQKLDVKIYGDSAPGIQKSKPSTRPASRPGAKPSLGSTANLKKPPIIIVPESTTALVTLYNAKELLQDCELKHITDTEMNAAVTRGEKKPDSIIIKRPTSFGKHIKFEVTDKVPNRESRNEREREKWSRVVAVVCLGKSWQFKEGYPFKGASEGDMMTLFHNLCGFHFYYAGDDIAPTVKSWNVKCLPLNRSQRHGDVQTVEFFFDTIADFLDGKARGRDGKYKRELLCRPDRLAYK